MANYSIDFEKVDAAFQRLGDEGSETLSRLDQLLDEVAQQAGGNLNEHEAHYLLTNLVQQREKGYAQNIDPDGRSVSGFHLRTAVK